jgi:hypothetical protein
MTGFECFDVFVIRCAKHTRRLRPAINDKSDVSELFLTDEFPNRSVRLNSLSTIYISPCKYKNKVLTIQIKSCKKSDFTRNLFHFIDDSFECFRVIHRQVG